MSTGNVGDDLKLFDALRLLWDEFAMRQSHYWRSVNRFSFILIALSVVPYVQQSVIDTLGPVGMGIIVISCIFSFLSAWMLYAEYIRLVAVREAYNRNLPPQFRRDNFDEYNIQNDVYSKYIQPFLCYPIGRVTSIVFAIGFGLVTHLNLLIYSTYKLHYLWPRASGALLGLLAVEFVLFVFCAWAANRRASRLARQRQSFSAIE